MDNPPRSTFVTVVAWIFIGLSACSAVISALQNAMIFLLFPRAELRAALASHPPPANVPPLFNFMLDHLEVLFAGMLLLTLFTLVISIGLLRRWNWARILFIALMALGIAWNIGGLYLQHVIIGSMHPPPGVPAEVKDFVGPFMIAIQVVSAVFAIAISALFGWIILRLASKPVVAEFQ